MMWNVSNHERAWLAYQCMFGEKISARVNISQFYAIIILHQVQMIIDIIEVT